MWSIDFLNTFLWKVLWDRQNVTYSRYLLCHEGVAPQPTEFENMRISDIGKLRYAADNMLILCREVRAAGESHRLQAMAIPTAEHWKRVRANPKMRDRYLQGMSDDQLSDVITNIGGFVSTEPTNRDDISFVMMSRTKATESDAMHKASYLGLELAPLKDVIKEYPRNENHWTGNKTYTLSDEHFELLFPVREFYDLFAIRDVLQNKWLACIAVHPEKAGADIVRERLYCDGVCGVDHKGWIGLKKTLDTLFISPDPNKLGDL